MGTLRVCRPADHLPSGTVGQWLPAPCNGGPFQRAATLELTIRRRGRLGPRAGIPKRKRPNCHSSPKRGTLKSAWDASAHEGEGARGQCAKGKGPRTPWTVPSKTQAAGRRDATQCWSLRPAYVNVNGIATPSAHLRSDYLVCQSRVFDVQPLVDAFHFLSIGEQTRRGCHRCSPGGSH